MICVFFPKRLLKQHFWNSRDLAYRRFIADKNQFFGIIESVWNLFSSLYNATSYATSAYAQRYAQLGKSNNNNIIIFIYYDIFFFLKKTIFFNIFLLVMIFHSSEIIFWNFFIGSYQKIFSDFFSEIISKVYLLKKKRKIIIEIEYHEKSKIFTSFGGHVSIILRDRTELNSSKKR